MIQIIIIYSSDIIQVIITIKKQERKKGTM